MNRSLQRLNSLEGRDCIVAKDKKEEKTPNVEFAEELNTDTKKNKK
jgi:hypothetical protein